MPETISIQDIAQPERLATQISTFFNDWDNYRTQWLEQQKTKGEYLFATSTSTTEVGESTPWKNNTTLPKLTQIRDNLHANYLATLFPNSNWLDYEGKDQEAVTKAKSQAAVAYMKHKWELDNARDTVSQLLLDWIDYGNCFMTTVYVNEQYEIDGQEVQGYVGPRLVRISPYDITFNPLASKFENTPKIIRSVKTLGDLAKDVKTKPEMRYLENAIEEITKKRKSVSAEIQHQKDALYEDDGFGGIERYYDSQYVEILDFYGDIYDEETGELLQNRLISVADRSVVIRNVENPSWTANSPIKHVGWRKRPDNLYAQGPLDNLVGMQYQIDKMQNTKADIADQVIHPVLKVRGQVEEFDWMPGERIYLGDDGDVVEFRVDNTYLTVSNNEIALMQAQMEEMAGAPRSAMGIRTPGEKTKFEVQVLDRATNRTFIHAVTHFEKTGLDAILNDMLELARRNMDAAESIRMDSDTFSAAVFKQINREDLSSKGTIKARGASRFAESANKLQELIQTITIAEQSPSMRSHLSGKKALKSLLELAGFDNVPELTNDNIGVIEQVETQQTAQAAQQAVAEEQAVGDVDPSIAGFADESLLQQEEQSI